MVIELRRLEYGVRFSELEWSLLQIYKIKNAVEKVDLYIRENKGVKVQEKQQPNNRRKAGRIHEG